MYLLKLAMRPWRAAPWSQTFTAIAVGFLLIMAGLMLWLERGLKPLVARMESEQVVTAYLDSSVTAESENGVADEIRVAVGARPEQVRVVRTEGFIGELKEPYPELARELRELGGQSLATLVPRFVSVSGKLPADAIEQVRKIKGIESAEGSRDRLHHVVGAFKALRWVARVLAIGLLIALASSLLQLARMNSQLHREALSLLHLWGAGPLAVRAPALLSSLATGFAGGVIAAGGWLGGGEWIGSRIREISPLLAELSAPSPIAIATVLIALGSLLGVACGALGIVTQSSGESRA